MKTILLSKVNLVISDLNDLSEYIKNFGLLTISNKQQQQEHTSNSSSNSTSTNQFLNINSRHTNNFTLNNSQDIRQQQQQNRSTHQRQLWNIMNIEDTLPYYSNIDDNNFTIPETTSRNRRSNQNNSQDRPIFGGGGRGGASLNTNRSNNNNVTSERRPANVPRSIGFSINLNDTTSYSNGGPHNNQASNLENRREGQTSLRSNTFVLEQGRNFNGDDESDEQVDNAITRRRLDNNSISHESALYNVRRARRARTPMTFNVMLDEPMEPLTNLFNESNTNDASNSSPHLASSLSNNTASPEMTTSSPETHSNAIINPKVNYASKKRAKMIVGKQGRDNGEFIWPIDVAINQFNQQIIVSDSANHRIQIFMEDGRYFKYFGKQGAFL